MSPYGGAAGRLETGDLLCDVSSSLTQTHTHTHTNVIYTLYHIRLLSGDFSLPNQDSKTMFLFLIYSE